MLAELCVLFPCLRWLVNVTYLDFFFLLLIENLSSVIASLSLVYLIIMATDKVEAVSIRFSFSYLFSFG